MEGANINNVIELGVAGIALVVVFILAIILYKVLNNKFGSQCATTPSNGNTRLAEINSAALRAHQRQDDHAKEHIAMMEHCHSQHQDISLFMGRIDSSVKSLLATQAIIEADVRQIKMNGGGK